MEISTRRLSVGDRPVEVLQFPVSQPLGLRQDCMRKGEGNGECGWPADWEPTLVVNHDHIHRGVIHLQNLHGPLVPQSGNVDRAELLARFLQAGVAFASRVAYPAPLPDASRYDSVEQVIAARQIASSPVALPLNRGISERVWISVI